MGLDSARFVQFAFDDRPPLLVAAGAGLDAGDRGQLAGRFGQVRRVWPTQKNVWPDQGVGVPLLCVAQRDGKGAQDAARALEARQLGPAGVEDFGDIGVKRIAPQVAVLGRLPPLFCLFIERRDVGDGRGDVRAEPVLLADRLRFEEAPPQDLGYILLAHRAGVLLGLASEDLGHLAQDLVPQLIVFAGVGGEQRGYHGAAVHLNDRLREVLEKGDHAPARRLIGLDLRAQVHQRFVQKNERSKLLLLRASTIAERSGVRPAACRAPRPFHRRGSCSARRPRPVGRRERSKDA